MSSEKYIPEKMKSFTPYKPIVCGEAIHMEANESPFDLPESVKREINDRIASLDFNRYPDPFALALCSAFADFYGIKSENTVAGNGSDELIMVLTAAFFEKDDKIAVVSPDFSMYAFYSELMEKKICVFDKADDMSLDLNKFSAFIKANGCKAAIFSNPCNPTGRLAGSREDVVSFIKGTDALIILDEAYMDFSSGSILQDACGFENLIVLKTLSKGFGLAGARIGFAVACDRLISVLRTAKSPYNVNSVSQIIGETVLKHKDLLIERHGMIKKERERIYAFLISKGYDAVKSDTNFVYVKTDDAVKIRDALRSGGIIIKNFGEKALRITAGSEEETNKFISLMDKI